MRSIIYERRIIQERTVTWLDLDHEQRQQVTMMPTPRIDLSPLEHSEDLRSDDNMAQSNQRVELLDPLGLVASGWKQKERPQHFFEVPSPFDGRMIINR